MKNTVGTGIKISVTLVSDKRIIDIRSGTIKLKHGRKAGPDTAMLGITDFTRIVLVGVRPGGQFTVIFSYVCLSFKPGVLPGCLGTKLKYGCGGLKDE